MQNLIIINLSEEELKKLIKDSVTDVLKFQKESYSKQTPPNQNDELIRLSEAARLLKVSKVTVHTWKRKGLIPFYRISNKIYFKRNEVISALRGEKYFEHL